ncbi:hypothetical protein Tco_0227062 [Tanacetum coccineum]
MKMTAIINITLEVKEVIKKETVVMTRPNLTMKKGQISSMKLMRMNWVSNLIKRKMKKRMKLMKKKKNDEFVKTPSNDTDDEDETMIKDKAEGDEDEGMDYTTNQFNDDVNFRLNEPVTTDEGFIQKEGTDVDMTNVHQGNENLEIHSIKVIALEKEVAELKRNDPLNTQVTTLVDEHLGSRLGPTRDEFMSYLSTSITARITEQVKSQLPQILPKEVSNFAPPVIKSIITKSLEHAVLAKESSQPKSTYEAAATLTEFELKKILIGKIDESQSYLTAAEHRECYDGLIKSYDLDKSLFSTYDKVYSLKRSRKDKDKDEDPSAGSDRVLKKRKTSKDAEPTKGPKAKKSQSGSYKGMQSQSTSSGKSVQEEEPEFEVADSNMPQDQEGNPGKDNEEPKGKTPQQGPTQSWLMTLASSADKSSKTFDELMSTPIDFSAYIMNGLKITNLTQETLLGPTFKLLKGTCSNYAELEYDFEECYKALLEKLDWDNPEGGDYPFDLTKPLPLVINGNRQMVPVDYFFNNDPKYLQGGILTMTYTESITKTKAAQYDLPGIEDMVTNIWSPVKVAYHKHALWVTRVEVMRNHGYGYLRKIEVRRADNGLYTFKEGDFPRLRINDIEDILLLVVQNRLTNLSGNDVSDFAIAL